MMIKTVRMIVRMITKMIVIIKMMTVKEGWYLSEDDDENGEV